MLSKENGTSRVTKFQPSELWIIEHYEPSDAFFKVLGYLINAGVDFAFGPGDSLPNQPPESLSETQLSKIENSNNLDNPSKLPIRQPKSITKLSIGDKKDSQYVYRNPKELLGMGSLSVSDLLGIPSLLRKETPAEVWQYVSEDCILNIYMYEDAISPEGFEVTYYEFNQVPEKKNSDEICFSKKVIKSY